jgi:trimeric autotransporter adhesin
MRRFLTLVCLLGLAIPAGISISGCTRNPAGNYCNGQGYGLKLTDVANLTLQPQIAGISLAYGQTVQAQSPSATTCKGEPASIPTSILSYGTTNNQLVDISPSGDICAGTWNRNTGGGIPDYTYCYFPNPLPSTCNPAGSKNCQPYGVAFITATAQSVTSNPVTVYVHPPISSISLVTTPIAGAPASGCYSQNQQAKLDANAYYSLNGAQTLLCAPGSSTLPECANTIGTLSFSVGTASVATINAATNVITAQLPGTTVINATIAQSSSSAGYFSTCPPASVKIALANGATTGVVTQGVQQNLTTSVIDTQGNPITGLTLNYESTNPVDISAGGSGSISTAYPGVASVDAICAPGICNPAPINQMGLNGTGLSISSNPVKIIVPGTTSEYAYFAAPGQSLYFSFVPVLNGTPGKPSRLPYVPNSMVMDQLGNYLYFGSLHELMVYSTAGNAITKQDPNAPGVVLAVAPNGDQLIINDQIRDVFYLYNSSSGVASTFGGLGVAAAWTPDSNTLYIVDSAALGGAHTNTLYVHNNYTGWSSYSLNATGGSQNVAVTIPGVGAYLAGNPTVARTWCPTGTVGNNASILFYPQSDSVNVLTSVLGATEDGQHMLGASLNGTSITLDDIDLNIPPNSQFPDAQCPETTTGTPPNQVETLTGLSTNPTLLGLLNLTGVTNATAVNQIVTGSAPATTSVTTAAPIAFVMYNTPSTATTPAALPYYLPQSSGIGSVGYVTFANSTSATPPTAPLAGAFSPDDSIFFVSTAGDNQIHYIKIPTNVSTSSPPVDSLQIIPNLPACTPVSAGGNDAGCLFPTAPGPNTVVPATVIFAKPRKIT